MPTDFIANAYSALVAAFKAGPLGSSNPPIVRSANFLSYDGPNPFPQTRVRAPDQAVRLIVDLGAFSDTGQFGLMPTAGNCATFDSFTQLFALKIIGPDRRTAPVTAALMALRACLLPAYLTLPRGCVRGPLRVSPMPANSPEFDGSDLRGVAGTLEISFNMPLSLE